MKLNLSDAKAFKRAVNNERVLESAFGRSGKQIVSRMIENGILEAKRISKRSREINIINLSAFSIYLEKHFFIKDIDKYIVTLSDADISRAQLAKANLSTKLKSTDPKSGFHISSYDGIEIFVNREKVKVDFPPGCALFIHKDSKIKLREDVLIVGVENFENISYAKLQKELFQTDKRVLFIERSRHLKNLLEEVSNEYLHFGDIDLAGINIYLTEYYEITKGRGRFFIPESVEEDLSNANSELYDKQYIKYKSLSSKEPYIQALIVLIKEYKSTVEQEFYICL